MPLEQAAPVLHEVCPAGHAIPAGPGFRLVHPDRFVDGNDIDPRGFRSTRTELQVGEVRRGTGPATG